MSHTLLFRYLDDGDNLDAAAAHTYVEFAAHHWARGEGGDAGDDDDEDDDADETAAAASASGTAAMRDNGIQPEHGGDDDESAPLAEPGLPGEAVKISATLGHAGWPAGEALGVVDVLGLRCAYGVGDIKVVKGGGAEVVKPTHWEFYGGLAASGDYDGDDDEEGDVTMGAQGWSGRAGRLVVWLPTEGAGVAMASNWDITVRTSVVFSVHSERSPLVWRHSRIVRSTDAGHLRSQATTGRRQWPGVAVGSPGGLCCTGHVWRCVGLLQAAPRAPPCSLWWPRGAQGHGAARQRARG